MKIEFRKETFDYWVLVYRDDGERVLCGLLMDSDDEEAKYWQIWQDIDVPPSLPAIEICGSCRSEGQVAASIEAAIAKRPEYLRLFS